MSPESYLKLSGGCLGLNLGFVYSYPDTLPWFVFSVVIGLIGSVVYWKWFLKR